MSEVEETPLPGVGLRYEFLTREGERLGVIHHRTGRRELFIAAEEDPDACREVIELDEDESRTLAEILGGATVVAHLTDLQQRVEGLAIDWLPIAEGSPYAGRTIGEARVRTRTGVSIVAVIRGERHVPAPGPDFLLQTEDILVVVGTPEGIERVSEILLAG